jgi:hypothetical protein
MAAHKREDDLHILQLGWGFFLNIFFVTIMCFELFLALLLNISRQNSFRRLKYDSKIIPWKLRKKSVKD